MAADLQKSLNTIPAEILYRIFDNLDAETIIYPVQCICKRLYAVVNTYQRYKLHLKSISKQKFHILCRAIHPENVISLVLSENDNTPGQIGLFHSLVRIQDYTRLQSITLHLIQEWHLRIILEHMTTLYSLVSLSIILEYDSYYSTTIGDLLSSVIRQRTLRKLNLTVQYNIINDIVWPVECSLQYLRIYDCIEIEQFLTILRCSPHLKTVSLRDCIISDPAYIKNVVSNGTLYQQLTSLTLENVQISMEMLEFLLSLTPSLVHLKLIGHGATMFNGSRWEHIIKTKLPVLDRFEFIIHKIVDSFLDAASLEYIIAPFRTPFWLETKHWLVTCVDIRPCSIVNLHSTPVCVSKVDYYSKSHKISCSTATPLDYDSKKVDNIRKLRLNLLDMMTHDAIEQVCVVSITIQCFDFVTSILLFWTTWLS